MGSNETALATRAPEVVDDRARARDLRAVFQPRTLAEALDLAERVAASSICPERYRGNAGDVFVAAAFGAEVGLTFMQSVQGVVVINGIPTIYGDHALGIVRASGLCQYVREWIDETNPENLVAHCVTHRKGEPEPVERTFSEDDAERALLLGKKGPWQTHEKRMLQMRARGFCLRDTYADVLRGLRLTEELEGEDLTTDDSPRATPAAEVERVAEEIPMPREKPAPAQIEAPASRVAVDDVVAAGGGTIEFARELIERRAPRTRRVAAADVSVDDLRAEAHVDAPAAPEPEIPEDEPEARREFTIENLTQRTSADDGTVTYTVVLVPRGGGEPTVARTRDRELALLLRDAKRAAQEVAAELAADPELGIAIVAADIILASTAG